jgi:Mrp family chromosome partitioning ATPase
MRVVVIDTPARLKTLGPALHQRLPSDTITQEPMLSSIITQGWQATPPDCVVLSQSTPIYERTLDGWITELHAQGLRVILVSEPSEPPGDALLQTCWRIGLWDVVLAPAGDYAPIAHRIHHPGTAGDWTRYVQAMPPPAHAQPAGSRSYFQRRPQLVASDDAPAMTEPPGIPKPSREPPAMLVPQGPYAARQIIAVQGLVGGAGASMIATQCAQRLSRVGSVLLWDWDARGGLTPWLGSPPPDDQCWEHSQVPDRFAHAPWAQLTWHFQDHWDVLTAQGLYPERAIIWSDAEMDAMVHWAERQYDYVVIDLGSTWSDPRHALVTSLADTALCVTPVFAHASMVALRWLEWVYTNDWRVGERHGWIATGHHLTPRDQRAWEHQVGERWMTQIDWERPRKGDPLTPVFDAITQTRWRAVPQS